MSVEEFCIDRLPLPYSFYGKAVLQQRRYQEGQTLPQVRLSWPQFRFDLETIKAYAKICQWPFDGQTVPFFFPHSFFGPLHLQMLTDANFPLKILGGVHLRNHILQHRPLKIATPYAAKLYLLQWRRRPQGIEVDFKTDIREGEELVWESVTSFLFRRKCKELDPESPLSPILQNLSEPNAVGSFPVPPLTGKQFGWITKDINPIHMSRFAAKLFGFRRDICHGMWALARSVPYLPALDWQQPVRNDVSFKGPLFIGHDICVKQSPMAPGCFELYSAGNERPCVLARFQQGPSLERLL